MVSIEVTDFVPREGTHARPKGPQGNSPRAERLNTHVDVRVDVTLRIAAEQARRLANHFVLAELGTGTLGERPALVIERGRMLWRVPIALVLPRHGRLGQIGHVDVDANSGQIIVTSARVRAMSAHAERLAIGSGV